MKKLFLHFHLNLSIQIYWGPLMMLWNLWKINIHKKCKNKKKKHNLKKGGDSVGGKFIGPKVKFIIHEDRLVELEQLLPIDASPFISYLRSIRELHIICITSEFTEAGWKMALFNFEQNFFFFMTFTA